MVIDNFVLKKKKGPFYSGGMRVINWRCVKDAACPYSLVTQEGQIKDMSRQHNHEPQPELYLHKQARAMIKESIAIDALREDTPAADAVNNVINEANEELRQKMGSIDAHKQAARRFNRKLFGKDRKQKMIL